MADSIDELVDRYGEGNVRKAMWLQDEIREDGLDGIHFMEYAESNARSYANLIVYQSIRSEMIKRF